MIVFLYKPLCQDCLRVGRAMSWEAVAEAARDGCGGEMCCCPACRKTIARLHLGVRAADQLGCTDDVLTWSAEEGGAFAARDSRPEKAAP